MTLQTKQEWHLEGLGAESAFPEYAEKMTLFGQFVGDWKIQERWLEPDGKWVEGEGEVHFAWILDGRAIQDVWSHLQGNPPTAIPIGTTIRFYDPKLDAWHVTWINPRSGAVRPFVARQIGDEIVLEGTTKDGDPEHWIFSEITPDSFRWRAVESSDKGKTWELTEEMSITRNKAN